MAKRLFEKRVTGCRTSCTKAPVPSVRHRLCTTWGTRARYRLQSTGTSVLLRPVHLRQPSRRHPSVDGEKIDCWSIFCKFRDTIVIFVLCQMNSLNRRVIWLWVCFKTLDWISFFAQWCIKVSYLFRICISSSPAWVEFLEQDKPSFLEVALSIWNKK